MTVTNDMITAAGPTQAARATELERKRKAEEARLAKAAAAQLKAAKTITGNKPTPLHADPGGLTMPWIFKAPSVGIRAAKNANIVITSEHPDYDELVKLNGGRYLIFREGAFATSLKPLARYIRESIRDGKMPGVTEDLTAFPLRCDHIYPDGSRCEFNLPTSTKKDRDQLYLHFLNTHMADMADRGDLLHPIEE